MSAKTSSLATRRPPAEDCPDLGSTGSRDDFSPRSSGRLVRSMNVPTEGRVPSAVLGKGKNAMRTIGLSACVALAVAVACAGTNQEPAKAGGGNGSGASTDKPLVI